MAKQTRVRRGVSPEELSNFCAQIAMMLNSGMTLFEGMEALAQTHRSSGAAEMYAQLSRSLTLSGSLYEALKQDARWPSYLVEMTGIGERTGRLEEVMNGLSSYYSRESRIRRAIVSAVTYPIVLGVMMLLILLVMIIKVLPVFQRVLGNIGVELTASGSGMMNFGVRIGWILLVAVGLAVLAVLVCCLLLKTKLRGKVLNLLRSLFPPVRKVGFRLASSRVASVLSMMLSSGFPLDGALEMVPLVLEDAVAREQIGQVRSRVAQGASFADALTETRLFDELYNCMIRMGCTVGCADAVMAKVAQEYETQVEDGIDHLVSIIEPTLVAVLSVVIGAVLLSVMLPMAGIISSIL